MPAHFQEAMPVLTVGSVEASHAFFCDRLGFAVVTEIKQGDTIVFSLVQRNDVTIMLQSEVGRGAELVESGIPASDRASVYVLVDSVEALVPEVADSDVVVPLRKTDYGMHEIGVREPGGNLIIFASRLAG